jgi:hypothetical protein
LLISSALALLYYDQYQQAASDDQRHVEELNTALSDYKTLQGSFNTSLGEYNTSLTLLEAGVASLNTSTPAYKEASAAISSLWAAYRNLANLNGKSLTAYQVNMLVNYENGTRRWYNDTSIQPGLNAYVVSVLLLDGSIQAGWYPQYQEHFVAGVNGVASGASDSWFVWTFGKEGWQLSQSGADSVEVYNGTTFAWTLCGYDSGFMPACSP